MKKWIKKTKYYGKILIPYKQNGIPICPDGYQVKPNGKKVDNRKIMSHNYRSYKDAEQITKLLRRKGYPVKKEGRKVSWKPRKAGGCGMSKQQKQTITNLQRKIIKMQKKLRR